MALRSRLPALARALEPQTLGSWMGLRCTTHRAVSCTRRRVLAGRQCWQLPPTWLTNPPPSPHPL